VVTLTKPRIIGCASSDSGSLCVVDPCYIEVSESGSVRLPSWNLYTSFDTELGDGEFVVYEQRDRRGKLKRIVIEIE
jgi:hypothetical protein